MTLPGSSSAVRELFTMKTGLFILLSFFSLCGFGQPAQHSILFEKEWGDPFWNYLEYADELSEGGYIVAGHKKEFVINGQIQIYVCRMDSYGSIEWEREIGTLQEDDWLVQVLKTKQGNYLILTTAGNAVSFGGDVRATLVSPEGNFIFDEFYYQNTGITDYAAGVCETIDNGYIISCALGVLPQGLHSPTLIKIDSLGNEVWRMRQDSLVEYNPREITTTPDNGCIVIGNANNANNNNTFVAKFYSDGNLEWIKYPYGKTDTLFNTALITFVSTDGSFNIPFEQEILNSSEVENHWIDFDATGNVTGSTLIPIRLRFPFKARPAIDPLDSSYIISNTPHSFDFGWIYKVYKDKTYKLIYEPFSPKYVGGGEYVIRTLDGGYFSVSTYSPDQNTTGGRFYAVKFSSDLRYTPEEYPETVRVFPNPSADGIFNLRFDMKVDDYVDVKIHSVDGKLVFSDRFFCPANTYTEYPVHLDLKSGSSGMYFFEAKTSTSGYFKKLITLQEK